MLRAYQPKSVQGGNTMRFHEIESKMIRIALCGAFLWTTVATAETPLERGTYLVQGIAACGNCHTTQGKNGPLPGMELAGMPNFYDLPGMKIHTPNITPDPETGIGTWTDDQIITAIREGKRPDGSMLGPFMPFEMYRGISDTDVQAIVAYLRHVKPVRHEVPRSVFNVPIPQSYGPHVEHVADVPRADPVAYGRYLAGPVGHCMECHTPWTDTGADYANRLGAGGNEFPGPWGVSVSANLTPAGLKSRTDDDIKKIITTGVRPDGSPMLPPMGFPYYAHISDSDLDAIVAYLRSLPPR
jgi:mono/diheme cytochrome c family protein